MTITFVDIIDYLGTFAFAVSGIRLASAKKFDWFGAFIVGMATAVGGGTVRDVMLGQSPFWMTKPIYFAINGFALLLFVFLHKQINRVSNTIFLFDTIGLGLFTVVGIQKTLDAGFPLWTANIMGMFTGAAGGVIRDILINESGFKWVEQGLFETNISLIETHHGTMERCTTKVTGKGQQYFVNGFITGRFKADNQNL